MFSVKAAKQGEASQGWEWQPEQSPAVRSPVTTALPPAALPRAAAFGSVVTGVAVLATTLLAAGGFVWPADAARQWETPKSSSFAAEVLAWDGARNSHTSPQAVLIELAQREGTDGAIVPPVKRQAPQMPAAQPEPAAAPPAAAGKTEAAPAPAEQAAPAANDSAAPGSWFDMNAIGARISDWLSKANRAYQGTIVKELSKPAPEDADAARLAAEKAAQEQAAREQAERAAAEKARAAAAKEEARKRAEAEAQRKAQEAAKAEEARKQAEAAAQQKAAQAPKPEPAAPDNKAAEQAEAEKLREAARLAEERKAQRLKEEQARREQAETERKAREVKAEQERKAKALAEAEAKLKAAQAARERREAEAPAAREQAEPVLRHRKWAVTIIPEPIGRPGARDRDDADGVMVAARRLDGRMSLGAGSVRGTAVKRWVMRDSACRYAGQKHKRRYVVARGDSLWRISRKYYHAGSKYPRIYRANRDRIADPDLIYPCQRFRVPRR